MFFASLSSSLLPALLPARPCRLPACSRLLAVLAACLLAAACSQGDASVAAAPPPAVPVSIVEAQPTNVPASIELMAQTEGANETEVRARVGGILIKRLYQEGMPVAAGQPLFQVDRAPYEIALAEAKARSEQTAREEARLKTLLAQQAVSRKEYEDATSANGVAQAATRQAELNLAWTTVSAPTAGTSGRAQKSEGNLIATGDLLTTIVQGNPMWVRFGLSQSDAANLPGGQLKPGVVSGVELILPDGSVYERPGKINFLASTIDPALGTQQLRAEFDNRGGRLLPGQFVRIRLALGERKGVFLVPQAAIMQTEQARLVMLVGEGNKVEARPVETAEWRGKDWVVLKGLQAGDKVIVDNLMKIRPGASVAPHPAQAPAGAAAATAATPTTSATPAAGR